MSAKHTSGPWKMVIGNKGRKFRNVAIRQAKSERKGDQSSIASVNWKLDEQLANAALIVAAPDLLAALRAVEEWNAREAVGELDENWDYETLVGNKVRAAIAKAEGKP